MFKPPVDLPLMDIVAVTHARSDTDTLVQDCCRTLARIGRQAVAEGRSLGRRLRPTGKSR